ncbi:ATP synthase F1 subunit delta [Myxococcota bacterium]|jgi:F-type H+-transporting ATPase subunit delta|nr:ATP synthase F1 subunit delta [Myxococcota bacterium]
MAASTLAHRYAKALLDIGVERKIQDQIGRELDRVGGVFSQTPELQELFRNPKFDVAARKSVLGELLKRVMVSPVTRNFLFLLTEKDRMSSLKDIIQAFHALADESSGRIRAQVTVASALSEPELARLRTVLGKLTGRQVIVEPKEDPRLIGGVVTRIGGKVYDGSVRAQLATLHARLRESSI